MDEGTGFPTTVTPGRTRATVGLHPDLCKRIQPMPTEREGLGITFAEKKQEF